MAAASRDWQLCLPGVG